MRKSSVILLSALLLISALFCSIGYAEDPATPGKTAPAATAVVDKPVLSPTEQLNQLTKTLVDTATAIPNIIGSVLKEKDTEIVSLKATLSTSKDENAKLSSTNKSLTDTITGLEAANAGLKKNVEDRDAKISSLQSDKDKLAVASADKDTKITALETQQKVLEGQLQKKNKSMLFLGIGSLLAVVAAAVFIK